MILTDISSINFIKLEEFVYNHPNCNFFQSTKAYHFFNTVENHEPILFVVEENGVIKGSLLAVIMKEGKGIKAYLSRRCIVWGGPISDNVETTELLLKELVNKVKSETIYIQFRNLWNFDSAKNIFLKYGFVYKAHLDIINDLTLSREEIKKKISKNKRGNVNKSTNKGTQFIEIIEINEFSKAVDLVLKTYKKIRLPCPAKNYFLNAFEYLNPLGFLKTFAAKFENEIIGVRLELCYRSCIYDWYAGTNELYKNKYPNDFLGYNILIWGKENNYQKFDFGGAGKPNVPYGVREYKMKFGGELVEFGRFEQICNYPLYQIGKYGLNIYKRFKSDR